MTNYIISVNPEIPVADIVEAATHIRCHVSVDVAGGLRIDPVPKRGRTEARRLAKLERLRAQISPQVTFSGPDVD